MSVNVPPMSTPTRRRAAGDSDGGTGPWWWMAGRLPRGVCYTRSESSSFAWPPSAWSARGSRVTQ